MATFLLVLICVGLVIGSSAYIAIMNNLWWKKKRPPGESNTPPVRD